MKTLKKLLAGALIAGTALALGGCKEKKTNPNSEQIARTDDTDRRLGTANDRYDDRNKDRLAAPESGSPVNPPPENDTIANNTTGSPALNANGPTGSAQAMNPKGGTTPQADTALNTQGTPGSPEIAHTGPQGSAVAPDVDVTPPDNTVAGANNPTGPSPVNDQSKGMEISRSTAFGQQGTDTTLQAKNDLDKAVNKDLKPSDTDDPQAKREAAYGEAAERLARLDARVSEVRARVDALSNKSAFTDTLTDLRRLYETAQSAIDQIRDRNVKLDDARESADRRMTQFETAINSVQKRIEKAASQT